MKSNKTSRWIRQRVAIVLAMILAFPHTSIAAQLGAGVVNVRADVLDELIEDSSDALIADEAVAGDTVEAVKSADDEDIIDRTTSGDSISGNKTYGAADIEATVSENLAYTGSDQTPEVTFKGTGTSANEVDEWLSGNKIAAKFKLTQDGDGETVSDASLAPTVKVAGVYSIYAESSDPDVTIKDESLGTVRVAKGDAEAPNAAPTLTCKVSDNKLDYEVTADASAVTNGTGKTLVYAFNRSPYSENNKYKASASENVLVNIKFAETVNNYASPSVSSAEITTPDESAAPTLPASTSFTLSKNVVISGNATSIIYYTIDGTEPTLSSDNEKGSVNLTIDKTTTVKAMALEEGKILSEVVSETYTDDTVVPSEIKLAPSQAIIGLSEDKIVSVSAVITPDNASNKEVNWSVSPAGVISLSKTTTSSGEIVTISSVSVGNAVVTATAAGDSSVTATMNVSVVDHKDHIWELSDFTWKSDYSEASATFICKKGSETYPAQVTMTKNENGKGEKAVIAYTARVTVDPEGNNLKKAISETKYAWAKDGKAATEDDYKKAASSGAMDDESTTVNLFYTDQSIVIGTGGSRITDKEGKLGKNSGKSDAYYDLTISEGNLKAALKSSVTASKDRKAAAKPANSLVVLPVYDISGNQIGDFEYSLPVVYEKPVLGVTNAKGTIISGKGAQTVTTVITEKKSTGVFEPLDITGGTFTLEGATVSEGSADGEIEVTASGKTKGKLAVKLSNWSEAVPVAYSVKESKKDVITATTTSVILNNTVQAGTGADQEVEIFLNGSDDVSSITVTSPSKSGGFTIDGIGSDGKLTDNKITIGYPEDPSTLKTGTYSYKFKSTNGGSLTFKVSVKKTTLDKAVKFKVQTKLDVTTGQSLILLPTLKDISGTITDVALEGFGDKLEAEYNEILNQIVISVVDGKEVKNKDSLEGKVVVTVDNDTECKIPFKFKATASKPKVKVDKITLPKSSLKDAEGLAYVQCSYKLNSKTMSIAPVDIAIDGATKVSDGVYKDTKTGATFYINTDNTITVRGVEKGGSPKVKVTFKGGTEVKSTLKIQVK